MAYKEGTKKEPEPKEPEPPLISFDKVEPTGSSHMWKKTPSIQSLTLGLAVALFAQPGVAQNTHNHGHGHGEHHEQGPTSAKKWETDAALKSGMDQIRQTMVARRADMDADRLNSRDYQEMGASVERHLATIVANCKLSPKVDQAFHTVVLADLTRDASLMRTSPKQAVQRLSAQGVLRTLKHYGDRFEHPGWSLDLAPSAAK